MNCFVKSRSYQYIRGNQLSIDNIMLLLHEYSLNSLNVLQTATFCKNFGEDEYWTKL